MPVTWSRIRVLGCAACSWYSTLPSTAPLEYAPPPQRWGRWGFSIPIHNSLCLCIPTRPPAPASFRTSHLIPYTPASVMWKMEYGAMPDDDEATYRTKISDDMFGILCRLDSICLSELDKRSIDKRTLAGYLLCNMNNLKDATRINA